MKKIMRLILKCILLPIIASIATYGEMYLSFADIASDWFVMLLILVVWIAYLYLYFSFKVFENKRKIEAWISPILSTAVGIITIIGVDKLISRALVNYYPKDFLLGLEFAFAGIGLFALFIFAAIIEIGIIVYHVINRL